MCDSGDGEKNLMFNCDKRNRKVSAGADAEREKGKKKKKKKKRESRGYKYLSRF